MALSYSSESGLRTKKRIEPLNLNPPVETLLKMSVRTSNSTSNSQLLVAKKRLGDVGLPEWRCPPPCKNSWRWRKAILVNPATEEREWPSEFQSACGAS